MHVRDLLSGRIMLVDFSVLCWWDVSATRMYWNQHMWITRDVVDMNNDSEIFPCYLQHSDPDRYSVEHNVFAILFHVV